MNEFSFRTHPPLDSSKSRIIVFGSRPGTRPCLEFLLARSSAETIFFDHEGELENWLRHCSDAARPIVGIVVDRTSRLPDNPDLLFCSIIADMKIPLIIVDSVYEADNGCAGGNSLHLGVPVYRTSLYLLPQLIDRIRTAARQECFSRLHFEKECSP